MRTKQFLTILALTLGLVLTLALLAGLHTTHAAPTATDRFVTPTGSGDCSQVSPCALQTALNLATNGDTIYVETEVLEMRASASKPDRGLVRLRHIGKNQAGMVVIELERTVLFLKRPI